MKDEMNLYKRCKNIFKAHGVDMGGGAVTDLILENAKTTGGIGYTDGKITTIEWDGNTDGLVSVPLYGGQAYVYKVSDEICNNSDIVGCIIEDSTGQTWTYTQEMYDSGVAAGGITDDYAALGEGIVIIIRKPNKEFPNSGIFAEAGTYMMYGEDGSSSYHTSYFTYGNETIHKIGPKYLPELEAEPCILITKIGSSTYNCNMSYDEIAELYAKYNDAIGLFDIRDNVFYLTGNEKKGTQHRCISVRHSDNFYFAFGFTDEAHYFEFLIRKDGTIEENTVSTAYMDRNDFYGGWYPLIVKSSTSDSTKKFKITVDDSGTISATEVTDA